MRKTYFVLFMCTASSSLVSGHITTLMSLNDGVLIEVIWSQFIDGTANVQLRVSGYKTDFNGTASDPDPDQARIMAINNALASCSSIAVLN